VIFNPETKSASSGEFS